MQRHVLYYIRKHLPDPVLTLLDSSISPTADIMTITRRHVYPVKTKSEVPTAHSTHERLIRSLKVHGSYKETQYTRVLVTLISLGLW